ncbi:MAG: hypothetical protein ACRDOV_05260 [Streptomyces sp.]
MRDEPGGPDEAALLALAAGYHERAVRLLGVEELGGHLMKVYAIEAPGRSVEPEEWSHALHLATCRLLADRGMGSLGLGFVMLHAGGDGDYVLVHTWVEGFMSRLVVFNGPMGEPESLRPASSGLAPCVWEAAVIAHEREVFLRHVLAGTGQFDRRLDLWGADVLSVPTGGVS